MVSVGAMAVGCRQFEPRRRRLYVVPWSLSPRPSKRAAVYVKATWPGYMAPAPSGPAYSRGHGRIQSSRCRRRVNHRQCFENEQQP